MIEHTGNITEQIILLILTVIQIFPNDYVTNFHKYLYMTYTRIRNILMILRNDVPPT